MINNLRIEIPNNNAVQENTSLLSEIEKKIDALITRLAFGYQFSQIAEKRRIVERFTTISIKEIETKILDEQQSSLKMYSEGLSTWSKLGMILTSWKIAPLSTLLVRNAIHPATSTFTFKDIHGTCTGMFGAHQANVRDSRTNLLFRMEENPQKLEQFHVYTRDHQQINCCILRSGPKDVKRPVMVMSQGNMMTYEQCYNKAKLYAEKYHVDVILYNPRGVVQSLGYESSTQDAVEDCKAVISHTLNAYCTDEDGTIDYNALAVYGLSLGGGISAAALEELSNEGSIPTEGIGLYLNHHSFSSLPGFVAGKLNNSGIILRIVQAVFWLMGMNPLNAHNPICAQNKKLARKIIIATGGLDGLMTGIGRTAEQVKLNRTVDQLNEQNIEFIEMSAFGHNESQGYVDWQRPNGYINRDLIKNTEDLKNIEKYENTIREWSVKR